jgi:hypothetical protein
MSPKYLIYHSATGLYNYESGGEDTYERFISINYKAGDEQARVTVAVSWGTTLYNSTQHDAADIINDQSLPGVSGTSYVVRLNLYKKVPAGVTPARGRPPPPPSS